MRPSERFSDRVDTYVRYRPGYPAEIVPLLRREIGLRTDGVVVDVGSGTGLSSKLFIDAGHLVYAVEPNQEMRLAAERLFDEMPRFVSVNGSAERTALEDGCCDLVVAGQAFHWFKREEAKREFRRILRPGGAMVLMWNDRVERTEGFMPEYEQFLSEHSTDYKLVNHKNLSDEDMARFFAPGVHGRFGFRMRPSWISRG